MDCGWSTSVIELILMDNKDSDMQKDRKNFQIEISRMKTLK